WRAEIGQHSPDAMMLADVLEHGPQQGQSRQDEHPDHDRAQQPSRAITLDRDEHIALENPTEDETKNQGWPRPVEMLHRPAEQAEEQERIKVAPVPRMLERPDIDEAEHARHDQRLAHCLKLPDLAAERTPKTETHHI